MPFLGKSMITIAAAFLIPAAADTRERDGLEKNEASPSPSPQKDTSGMTETILITTKMAAFTVTLADTSAARKFKELLPMTINMEDINGNEKYYSLPLSLPESIHAPKNINPGDLMLWGNRGLVLFYKKFTTPYSYTKIGVIHNPSGLQKALGGGNTTVTFEKK